MSKSIKRVSIILLSLLMSAMLFIAGGLFIKPASASTTGNMQAYKEGKVKFEDRLWDASNYTSSKVIKAANSSEFNAKLNSLTSGKVTAANYDTRGCTAYFIDGATFGGAVTKVFVYVGIPASASKTNKVPAVVLVHGGGGTAYSAWVKHWVDRGYAAIAMDTEGMVPTYKEGTAINNQYMGQIDTDGVDANPYHHGPQNWGFYDVRDKNDVDGYVEIEQQWFYQAVSSVIASRTFIGTFDGVDNSNVAITGISYGSYLTSITCGYDYRYACAVPVYGSLDQANTETYFGNNIRENPWTIELWDDGDVLKDCPVPFYYLMGNMDAHFSVTATTSVAKKQGESARMHIVNNFGHSHSYGAVNIGGQAGDVMAYIDTVCKGNPDYIQITQHPTRYDAHAKIKLPSGISINNITLWYTNNLYLINSASSAEDSGIYLDYTGASTTWNSVDITAWREGNTINIPVQPNTKHYYVNITDNYGRGLSSHVVAVDGEGPSYFNKLIAFDTATSKGKDVELPESAWWNDENGWNNMPYDYNTYYVKAENGGYPEVMGSGANTTGSLGEVTGNYYGVKELGYNAGLTSMTLNAGARITNMKDFSVYKPIEFYYNFYSAGQSWYTFSIFDDIENTFTAQNLWHPGLSGSKFVMMGANYNQDPKIDLFYNLRVHDGVIAGGTTELVSETAVTSSNWQTFWYKVRIEIGENDTKVYVNDILTTTMTSVNRSSFKWGVAYMVLETQGSAETKFTYKTQGEPVYMLGSTSGREFSYEQDDNGWSTYIQDPTKYWVDATNNAVQTYTQQSQSQQFGAYAHSQAGNITRYQFNQASYVLNYTKYDVTKPIEFYYNISTVNNATSDYGTWYNMALFDTFERAFRTGTDQWNTTNKAKVVLFGANSTKDAVGDSRTGYYNKLVISRGGFGEQSTGELFANYSPSTWDDQWVKVTINIGTDKTTITVKGATTTTLSGNSSLTQSSFVNGYALIGFSTQAGCHVNFRMTDEEPSMFIGKVGGAEFVDSFDANGFSNYIQQSTNQVIVNWKGETAVAGQYGRVAAGVGTSGTFKGYSNIKLNKSGFLVNNRAFDVTKPIRLIYQAKDGTNTNSFYMFALHAALADAYKGGNEIWNSNNYVMNLQATCNNTNDWANDIKFGKIKIGAHDANGGHGYVYTTNDSIYPEGYSNTTWYGAGGFVFVDIVIGTERTAVVANGVTHYVSTTRANFPSGYAYFSLANIGDSTIQMKIEQPEVMTHSKAITINEDIELDYSAKLAGNYVNPQVTFEFMGKAITDNTPAFKDGKYYFNFDGVTPQYLGEDITVTLKAMHLDSSSVDTIATNTYSIRSYCEEVLALSSTDAKLKTLLVDFLNYGAAAQQYVNYNTEDLANKNIDAYQSFASNYDALTPPTSVLQGANGNGVKLKGAYLLLDTDVDLVVELEIEEAVKNGLRVEFVVGGVTTTVASADFAATGVANRYSVKLNGITPTMYDGTIQILVKDASNKTVAYANYSVNSHIANRLNKAGDLEVALLKALYCYGVSAKNYVG